MISRQYCTISRQYIQYCWIWRLYTIAESRDSIAESRDSIAESRNSFADFERVLNNLQTLLLNLETILQNLQTVLKILQIPWQCCIILRKYSLYCHPAVFMPSFHWTHQHRCCWRWPPTTQVAKNATAKTERNEMSCLFFLGNLSILQNYKNEQNS
jgi:hypothetical protein